MNKKVPVVKVASPPQAVEVAGLPVEMTVALADIAGVMREGLLALSTAAGLVVMRQMMEGELAGAICERCEVNRRFSSPVAAPGHEVSEEGAFGAKQAKLGPDRVGNWHGTTSGQVVLGGRKVTVERPRGRLVDGGEIELATW